MKCGSLLFVCYNRDLAPVYNQKLEVGVDEGVGRSQLLVALSFEVRPGVVNVTIATWPLSKIRSWKPKFVRQLAEVNCWLCCFLKCG